MASGQSQPLVLVLVSEVGKPSATRPSVCVSRPLGSSLVTRIVFHDALVLQASGVPLCNGQDPTASSG